MKYLLIGTDCDGCEVQVPFTSLSNALSLAQHCSEGGSDAWQGWEIWGNIDGGPWAPLVSSVKKTIDTKPSSE